MHISANKNVKSCLATVKNDRKQRIQVSSSFKVEAKTTKIYI